MTRKEMIALVDKICENEGYNDSPAYDLIYSQIQNRDDKDAESIIIKTLKEYNS